MECVIFVNLPFLLAGISPRNVFWLVLVWFLYDSWVNSMKVPSYRECEMGGSLSLPRS